MAELSRSLFTGPGLVIVQMMIIAVVSWIAGYFATAVGKGQIASMIHVAAVFVCLALVIGTIYNALTKASQVMGF